MSLLRVGIIIIWLLALFYAVICVASGNSARRAGVGWAGGHDASDKKVTE